MENTTELGPLLREWRQRRRMSQLDLALEAGLSARHLSFLETGRAGASREMILRLAESLDLPLRETGALLLAGGFAPVGLRAAGNRPDPAIDAAIQQLLDGHQPFPALALDRYWTIRQSNRAVAGLLAGVAPALLVPPVNAIRLTFHPEGLAPRIFNLPVWRAHLIGRLRRQARMTGDAALARLIGEIETLSPAGVGRREQPAVEGPVVPLRLASGNTVLNLISTTTVFGSPVDVELSELAIETYFPADEPTRRAMLGGL